MDNKVYRLVDVASAAGVSVTTLMDAMNNNKLPAGDIQIGNRRCWSESGVEIVKEWYKRPRGWRRDHTYLDLDLNLNNTMDNKETA